MNRWFWSLVLVQASQNSCLLWYFSLSWYIFKLLCWHSVEPEGRWRHSYMLGAKSKVHVLKSDLWGDQRWESIKWSRSWMFKCNAHIVWEAYFHEEEGSVLFCFEPKCSLRLSSYVRICVIQLINCACFMDFLSLNPH